MTHGRFDSNTKILMHEYNNLEITFIIDVHSITNVQLCNQVLMQHSRKNGTFDSKQQILMHIVKV